MYQPDQIHSVLHSDEELALLPAIIVSQGSGGVSAISRRVCEEFGFLDARGHLRKASCLAALRELDKAGRISLPQRDKRGPRHPRGLGYAVEEPKNVPVRVDQIKGLRLVKVEDDEAAALWNELIEREHPQGAVIHAGCQIRYLAASDHGWLGAVGFSAPAHRLYARDAWVGWDEPTRAAHLHRVTGLSRFLIRPGACCRNLASRVLGMCLAVVGDDFESRYGYRPLLVETFVDPGEHSGVSFRATNWELAGKTSGRGRWTRGVESTPKLVYIYALRGDWREEIGVCDPKRVVPLGCGEGLSEEVWAQEEFGNAPLGDKRWSRRLVISAGIQARKPGESFVGAAEGNNALISAYYRMTGHPDKQRISVENILSPHRERTLGRMQSEKVVLSIQDGTDLNFAGREAATGLGVIGRNRAERSGTLGLHMHSTYVVNEEGVPLGVGRIEYDAPDGKAQRDKPVSERKTQRWLRGLDSDSQMALRLEGVKVVSVMDREADFRQLFSHARKLGNIELIVRASHNRNLGKESPKLFEKARSEEVKGYFMLEISRLSARGGTHNQKAAEKREAREARMELRWFSFEMPSTGGDKSGGGKAVRVTLVHLREEKAPEKGKRIEWFLLTTLPVCGIGDAKRVAQFYGLRWRIEDWHRILKTGCKIESVGHHSAEGIKREVTVNAVIAWRLATLMLLGRQTPDMEMEKVFSEVEVRVLGDVAKDRGLPKPVDLRSAMLIVAIVGGYRNRKHDGPPGPKVIWRGYYDLGVMVRAYELMGRVGGEEGSEYRILSPD